MLTNDHKELIEEVVSQAVFSAKQYLETSKPTHLLLLEKDVQKALDVLDLFREDLKEDESTEFYKTTLMYPMYILREAKGEK